VQQSCASTERTRFDQNLLADSRSAASHAMFRQHCGVPAEAACCAVGSTSPKFGRLVVAQTQQPVVKAAAADETCLTFNASL
jgi:hypothetical protein